MSSMEGPRRYFGLAITTWSALPAISPMADGVVGAVPGPSDAEVHARARRGEAAGDLEQAPEVGLGWGHVQMTVALPPGSRGSA